MKLMYASLFLVLFLVACQPVPPLPESAPVQKNVDLFGQDLDQYVDSQEISNKVQGFLAKPKEAGNYPGVIMIHEWWGLNDNIKEMAKILAKEGYVVFAIDLYGEVAADAARAGELSAKVRDHPDEAVQKMKDAVAYLKEQQQVEKIASLGWCFGGQQSLQLALNEELDATVIYYGRLTDDKEQLKNIGWPVLGIFGEEDTSIPVSSVKDFETALNQLGIKNEIYIYPGVGHAFANPSGANYAEEETVDAWEKTVVFLNENLKEN
ncbi:MAG: dienelactone hydrolase family protein [Nanoarchaeota archaeon]|nr:dienelactone hydrolase family protein [Nanoarchaeota archaeon]